MAADLAADSVREQTRKAAVFYRSLGWNPLPSSLRRKAPILKSYAHLWETSLEESYFEPGKWNSTNVQIMTGSHWGLVVIDCDGDEAIKTWADMRARHDYPNPRTWVVISGSGHGRHYYYRVPKWPGLSIQSRWIWGVIENPDRKKTDKVIWKKHCAIEVLADKKLIMAPPSYHNQTRQPYQFARGCSPLEVPKPAWLPPWVYAMPEVRQREKQIYVPPMTKVASQDGHRKALVGRRDVLDAIPDKLGLALEWGLQAVSRTPNACGFVKCHAVSRGGRDGDRHPSASFKPETGVYWEEPNAAGSIPKAISLFDLGVLLRPHLFGSWQECLDWCARTYGVPGYGRFHN